MARRRKGRVVNGWLNLDKPEGLTSTQAVNIVRRLFDAQKTGHGGTLDPLATGVLPIAFGEATKTSAYIMDAPKTYRFAVKWGEGRDTDDAEGAVTAVSDVRPTADQIRAVLGRFTGEIEQTPPVYSAIKVEGERAYDLARRGETVVLEPRLVEVHGLELLDEGEGEPCETSAFVLDCGKGTYVRSLVRDLGHALGTAAHVIALRRTRVGRFTDIDAIPLEKLREMGDSAPPDGTLVPIMTALADIPALAVIEPEARRVKCGQIIRVPSSKEGTVRVVSDDRLIALAEIHDGEVQPVRIFNL
jgi:tRNA pseudouridine55 synthase